MPRTYEQILARYMAVRDQEDSEVSLDIKALAHVLTEDEAEIDVRLDAVEAKNTEQDGRLTDDEVTLGSYGTRITAAEVINDLQDISIDALEVSDASQGSRLTDIEALDVVQNGRLTTIEALDVVQNGRLTALEARGYPVQISFVEITSNTTTTSTSYVDLLSTTLTTAANKVLITAAASSSGTLLSGTADFRLVVDAANYPAFGSTLTGIGETQCGAVQKMLTLGAGSHTIKLQWKTGGGTAQIRPVTTPSEYASLTVQEIHV